MRLSAILISLLAAGPAAAATANFDSVTSTQNFPAPPGYAENGFTFRSTVATAPYVRIFSTNPPSPYILACGQQAASPCEDADLEVVFPFATDAFAVDIRAVDDEDSVVTFNFSGPDGSVVQTCTGFDTDFNALTSISFSGLGGVRSVVISDNDPAGVGFDNFRIGDSVPDTDMPAVPIPATGLLLFGALASLGAVRRRS